MSTVFQILIKKWKIDNHFEVLKILGQAVFITRVTIFWMQTTWHFSCIREPSRNIWFTVEWIYHHSTYEALIARTSYKKDKKKKRIHGEWEKNETEKRRAQERNESVLSVNLCWNRNRVNHNLFEKIQSVSACYQFK